MRSPVVRPILIALFMMSTGISAVAALDNAALDGVDKHPDGTREELSTDSEEENKEFPRLAAAGLNLVPSFGVGSFVQGNKKAGFIQAAVQGGALIAATVLFARGAQESGTLGGAGHAILGVTILGGGLLVGDVYGVIAALTYE